MGLEAGDSIIELLRPLDPDSPIARFRGDAETKLHHTAYRVDDIATALADYKAKGVRLIDEVPRKGAHGNLIAFLHPKVHRWRADRTLPARALSLLEIRRQAHVDLRIERAIPR